MCFTPASQTTNKCPWIIDDWLWLFIMDLSLVGTSSRKDAHHLSPGPRTGAHARDRAPGGPGPAAAPNAQTSRKGSAAFGSATLLKAPPPNWSESPQPGRSQKSGRPTKGKGESKGNPCQRRKESKPLGNWDSFQVQ